MNLKDFVDLLSAITFFVLVFGGLILLFILIFKPPKTVTGFLKELQEYKGLIRRFKLGNFEAELDRAITAPVPQAVTSALDEASLQLPAETGKGTEPQPPDEAKEPESPFSKAWELLHAGKYQEGMSAMREASVQEENSSKQVSLIAFGQYIGFSNGASQALDDLRHTAEEYPQNASARRWYAQALTDVGKLDAAINELQKTTDIAKDQLNKVRTTIQLAHLLKNNDQHAKALSILKQELSSVTEQQLLAELYVALAKVYEAKSPPDNHKALMMYELALRSTPTDNNLRFSVAYSYGKQSAMVMSLFHYQELLRRDPDHAMALNNAGVEADLLSLPITSIRYYRKSEKLDETLAMSNLALQLIQAGFIDEASEILKRAQTYNDVNQRVLVAIGEIARTQQSEETKLERVRANASQIIKWRYRHAEAMLAFFPDPNKLSGSYLGDPPLDIRVETDGTVAGTFSLAGNEVTLSGTLEGSAITFTWETKPQKSDSLYSFLVSSKVSGHGVLIVNDDQLIGFRASGEYTMDAKDLSEWNEWSLKRTQS